jgi:glycosyltransferase involved in cell wall biosynthesis
LQQHIRLPGYIDHADLPAVYSAASAFLYPSRRESFGLPILEAMACGTPVITSDAAAMPETAGEAALLVDPDRPSDLAGAMRRVVADTRLRRRLRDRGLRRAGTFSWERTARRLLRAYEEMGATAGRSSPRPVHALAGCS